MPEVNIPLAKIGSQFILPSWRYEALRRPQDYDLNSFLSNKKKPNPGYLKRLSKKLDYEVKYVLPASFHKFNDGLDDRLSLQLKKVWDKQFKKNNDCKIHFVNHNQCKKLPAWNMRKVEKLNDDWLKRLVKNTYNFEGDNNIEWAVQTYRDPINSEIVRFIGYAIFAGISDIDIAKRWKIGSPHKVAALRNIFFDFSHFPKDKIALWSLLRQLVKMEEITEDDYRFYKRVYDLGELGLSAQVAFTHMTVDDQKKVERYIGKTAVSNTFNLEFCIKDMDDALNYNKVVGELAKVSLQHEMIVHKSEELKLLKLQINRTERDMNLDANVEQPEDIALFEEMVRDMSRYDAEPKYVTFIDLKKNKD